MAGLEAELADLEKKEEDQLNKIEQFKAYRNNIEAEENQFWSVFNEYEKQLNL